MTKTQARRRLTECIEKVNKVQYIGGSQNWAGIFTDADWRKVTECSRTLFKLRAKLDRS